MRIGKLAGLTGVTTKTIRYYEDIGILPEPERASNDYRDYGPEAVDRLRFIRDAQATGLTLTEIGWILDLRGRGESSCEHVVELLEAHLEDLDLRIEELHRARDKMVALTRRARRLDPAECTDPHRCQTITEITDGKRREHVHAGHTHETPTAHAHP